MIKVKKYNKNIYINKYIPTSGFIALAFFDVIFWREEYDHYLFNDRYNDYVKRVVNHENIHVAQMKDFCKWLPIGGTLFYITYVLEWLIRLFIHGPKNAYSNISFEREAKQNERNMNYKNERDRFANFKKYFKK
jgi:hypothetical protein